MTQPNQQEKEPPRIYILWGRAFEAMVASVFAVELRYVGLPVKLVGLTSQRAAGRHGLALYPDIFLSDALACRASIGCLVLPCSRANCQHITNDPRVQRLLDKAAQQRALFVVSELDAVQFTKPTVGPAPSTALLTYADADNIVDFARAVAARLQTASALS